MNQRKEPADRAKRRGSENRLRQNFVGVRFNKDEYGALLLVAAEQRKGLATVLREAFLRTIPVHGDEATEDVEDAVRAQLQEAKHG